MVNQQSRAQQATEDERSRSPLTITLAVVLAVGVIGFGIWAIVQATGSDDIDVATEMADEWLAAWAGDDADAVAAMYTEDGTHVTTPQLGASAFVGREAIRNHAVAYLAAIQDGGRTGDLVAVGNGVYTVPIEFTGGGSWVATVEIEVEGDLLSRTEFLTVEAVQG